MYVPRRVKKHLVASSCSRKEYHRRSTGKAVDYFGQQKYSKQNQYHLATKSRTCQFDEADTDISPACSAPDGGCTAMWDLWLHCNVGVGRDGVWQQRERERERVCSRGDGKE